MPGGHASHKGTGAKPNINSNGVISEAADQSLEAEDLLPEELVRTETLRTDEYVDFPPATERPEKKPE